MDMESDDYVELSDTQAEDSHEIATRSTPFSMPKFSSVTPALGQQEPSQVKQSVKRLLASRFQSYKGPPSVKEKDKLEQSERPLF